MSVHSVAVVGAGLIGSSAARWAATLGRGVVLVGPGEQSLGHCGAWCDEGRTTRVLEPSLAWRILAEQSVKRYSSLEQEAGHVFYHEVGYLCLVGEERERAGYLERMERCREGGHTCHILDHRQIQQRFPYLHSPLGTWGLHLPVAAGHLNPRTLVRLQQELAVRAGASIVREGVVGVRREGEELHLTTTEGRLVRAKKVILATGAHTNLSGHLQELAGREADISLAGQTVAYLQVPPREAARLASMPTMSTCYSSGCLDGSYVLPPLLHPDGRHYIKLGHHGTFEMELGTREQLEEWYRECGDRDAVAELAAFLQHLLPGLQVEGVRGGACVTANTPSKEAPYVQEVAAGVVVAAGGCGQAAKCCDEIGRIAAVLGAEGRWDSDIPQHMMEFSWK